VEQKAGEVLLEAAKQNAALSTACARAAEVKVAIAEARALAVKLTSEQRQVVEQRLAATEERLARELPSLCPGFRIRSEPSEES
jgi:hypothetical protein